ncbi:hypothetical protein MASR2M54_26030 [Aliarcobacter cryaerophilus]
MVKKLQKNKNLILILDEVPSFSKAKAWLDEEVNGYGNALMQDLFFILLLRLLFLVIHG